jgi:hypothetical protein
LKFVRLARFLLEFKPRLQAADGGAEWPISDGILVYAMMKRFIVRMGITALVLAGVFPTLVLSDPGETMVAATSEYERVNYRPGRSADASAEPTLLQQLMGEVGIQQLSQLKSEVQCLAQNIYFEARSEPEEGQRAVGHVVMNRIASKKYPDTVCEVVHQGGEVRRNRCQFSWWCDGRSDEPKDRKAWKQSVERAYAVYFGFSKDPTNGALWYHATYVNPYWKKLLVEGDRIGQHIFYHSRVSELL